MASGTITGRTSNQYIDCKIEWTSTADIVNNKSRVTAILYYKRNNSGYETSGTGSFAIMIGKHEYSQTKYLTIKDSWVEAIRTSTDVSHSSNGTAQVDIMVAYGIIPGTTLTSTTCSRWVTLDTIKRASTIDSLSCNTKYFTGTLTYYYTPKYNGYYNKCNISLKVDGEYKGIKSVSLGRRSAGQQSATVTFTEDELASIYNKLPNSAVGTLRFTFRTYSDSDYSTQVGDYTYKEIELTIPNDSTTKPTVSMTLKPVTSLQSPFSNLYIQGFTGVEATFSGEGKFNADISSYRFAVANKEVNSAPYISQVIYDTSLKVRGRSTDTRGYHSATVSETVKLIPYSKPSVLPASGESSIICARADENGNLSESGTYLKIKARRSYSKVESDGVQYNFCEMRWRYKIEGDEEYSNWKTLIGRNAPYDDSSASVYSHSVIELKKDTSYIVQIGVVDDLGGEDYVQTIIPTDFTTIDIPDIFRGRRVGFFRYVADTDEDGMYVGLPIFGGSIDSLKLGLELEATAQTILDLNDIKTPGCYYSSGADHSQYIDHTPYKSGGFGLEVRELQSADHIRQTLYYGRTTWVRHWNTTEWSAWIRCLMTTASDDTSRDFVIESGTYTTDYGTWTYKKWLGGTYQMFGKFTVTPTESTQHTSVYRTNSIGIPAPFDMENAIVSGSAMGYYWISNGGISDDRKNVAFRLISDEAFSTTTAIDVRLSVVGNYE